MGNIGTPLNLVLPRRIVQTAFFGLWYYVFYRTYVAADNLIHGNPVPDLFLRTDPLAGVVSSAAARSFAQEAVFWVPMIVLTLVLGRVFCGWACPFGTLSDAVARLTKTRPLNRQADFRTRMHWKYLALTVIVAASIFSVSLLGHLDPLCLLVRAFSFSITPFAAVAENGLLGRNFVFGYGGKALHFFQFNLIAGATLALILYLNKVHRRFFCRTLCPLGAFYGTAARFSLLKVSADTGRCKNCFKCAASCNTGAIDFPEKKRPVAYYRKAECIACYTCVDVCPEKSMRIRLTSGFLSQALDPAAQALPAGPREPGRRGVLKAMAAGAVLAPFVRLDPLTRKTENNRLIRPPFARQREGDFLALCIRCGLCMQVCKTNTLQPAYFAAGVEGLMTPAVTPEIGGCLAECTACGAVCPTNAIAAFTLEKKHAIKMGTAKLELDRCIGWTENKDCNECVKVCPAQAIKVVLDKNVFKPVKIVSAECTGCALCEKRCHEIIVNQSACVTTQNGRGLPTDFAAIQRNLKAKKEYGKGYLPKV